MTPQPDDHGSDATISVIMPARNAGETIAETLESLLAQTRGVWRAIIVDDGSTDTTRAIAEDYAKRDPRITVIDGPQRGSAGAARNAGLARADGEWILFLDSDDLLDPDMMERMMAALAAHPHADAVHCHWRYIDWDGAAISEACCEETGEDLFPALTRYCAFAIHSCVFRRSLLDKAGVFDEDLVTCEDFDLWQRIARCGARFVALDACLATYRLRPNLSWFDAEPFLATCLEVIRRGHKADPRLDDAWVPARHQQGRDVANLACLEVNAIVMASAMQIARGLDATLLFAHFPPGGCPLIDSVQTAYTLMSGIPLTLCQPRSAWQNLWVKLKPELATFLETLEKSTGSTDLASRTLSLLERLAIRESAMSFRDNPELRLFGKTAAVGIDISRSIDTIRVDGADRLECFVFHDGDLMGTIPLPVFDGQVHAIVLKDAIAHDLSWQMLNRLISEQVHPLLTIEKGGNGWRVRRGKAVLAEGLPADPVKNGAMQGQADWVIFIQELIGLPDWQIQTLYDPFLFPPDAAPRSAAGKMVIPVELSEPIPHLIEIDGDSADIEVRVGGSPVFLTRIAAKRGRITSGVLRATLLDRGKIELARAAAREAIIGYDGDLALTLTERLKKAAKARAGSGSGDIADDHTLVVGSIRQRSVAENLRRAALPSALADKVRDAMNPGQPVIEPGGQLQNCLVLPELMARPAGYTAPAKPALLDRLLRRDRDGAEVIPGSRRIDRAMERAEQIARKLGAIPPVPHTDRLPILMYHAVGDTGPEALSRWRITTAMFDAHMRYLKETGFTTTTLDEWRAARETGKPLRGRRVIITFDDAYVDFEQNAMPVLQRHDLSALLFVPTGKVGRTADWDSWAGSPLPLLDWDGLRRVRDAGIEIGSHSVSHQRMTGLSPAQMVEELLESRIQLSRRLGISVDSFAYPSGDYDEIVEHLASACGYRHGLTTDDGLSELSNRDFALARVEVMGQRTLEDFVARLPKW